MDTFKNGTTVEEQAVTIAMTEITAIHRDFDVSYWQVPCDATDQQASKVRYYLAKLHDDLGYKMKFDFVPLLSDPLDEYTALFGVDTEWLNHWSIE